MRKHHIKLKDPKVQSSEGKVQMKAYALQDFPLGGRAFARIRGLLFIVIALFLIFKIGGYIGERNILTSVIESLTQEITGEDLDDSKVRERIIREYLKYSFSQSSADVRVGRMEMKFANASDDYVFIIKKIGFKTSLPWGDGTKQRFLDDWFEILPGESVTRQYKWKSVASEVKTAYPLLDEIEIKAYDN